MSVSGIHGHFSLYFFLRFLTVSFLWTWLSYFWVAMVSLWVRSPVVSHRVRRRLAWPSAAFGRREAWTTPQFCLLLTLFAVLPADCSLVFDWQTICKLSCCFRAVNRFKMSSCRFCLFVWCLICWSECLQCWLTCRNDLSIANQSSSCSSFVCRSFCRDYICLG